MEKIPGIIPINDAEDAWFGSLVKRFWPWFRSRHYKDHAGGTAFDDATREFLEQNEGVPSLNRLRKFRSAVSRLIERKPKQEPAQKPEDELQGEFSFDE